MWKALTQDCRCVITIDGYYEWYDPEQTKKNAQPYYIYPKDGEPLTIAGLFRPEKKDDGSIVNQFVILTLQATDTLKFIHHRMPVILTKETREEWLNPETDWKKLYSKLYQASPKDMISYHKVASVVNSIKNDKEDCLLEMAEYEKKLHSRGLGRFFGKAGQKKEEKKEEKGPEGQTGNKILMDRNSCQKTPVKFQDS